MNTKNIFYVSIFLIMLISHSDIFLMYQSQPLQNNVVQNNVVQLEEFRKQLNILFNDSQKYCLDNFLAIKKNNMQNIQAEEMIKNFKHDVLVVCQGYEKMYLTYVQSLSSWGRSLDLKQFDEKKDNSVKPSIYSQVSEEFEKKYNSFVENCFKLRKFDNVINYRSYEYFILGNFIAVWHLYNSVIFFNKKFNQRCTEFKNLIINDQCKENFDAWVNSRKLNNVIIDISRRLVQIFQIRLKKIIAQLKNKDKQKDLHDFVLEFESFRKEFEGIFVVLQENSINDINCGIFDISTNVKQFQKKLQEKQNKKVKRKEMQKKFCIMAKDFYAGNKEFQDEDFKIFDSEIEYSSALIKSLQVVKDMRNKKKMIEESILEFEGRVKNNDNNIHQLLVDLAELKNKIYDFILCHHVPLEDYEKDFVKYQKKFNILLDVLFQKQMLIIEKNFIKENYNEFEKYISKINNLYEAYIQNIFYDIKVIVNDVFIEEMFFDNVFFCRFIHEDITNKWQEKKDILITFITIKKDAFFLEKNKNSN